MEGTCWMCFEKRHLHAALEGCDKYLYPRLYIHSKHSKLASTQARHAARPMDSHQSMQTMPRCQWISLWGRYATHSTKMLAPPLSLSRPPSVTPSSTNTDNRHRCETKKEENEDWKTGSSISGKKNNNINKKKYKKKTKRNTTTTENTQILICRHFSRY